MSSIKEMAIQCKQLDAQITKAAQKAFKDCSEAGLVLEEHWPSGVWEPAYDYKYYDHEIDATGIDIQGHKYIGGGEYACLLYTSHKTQIILREKILKDLSLKK